MSSAERAAGPEPGEVEDLLDDAHFERCVIQAALVDPEAFEYAAERLEPDQFNRAVHGWAWEFMLAERAAGRAPDNVGVMHHLKGKSDLLQLNRMLLGTDMIDHALGYHGQPQYVRAVLVAHGKRLRKRMAAALDHSSNGGPPLEVEELLELANDVRVAEQQAADEFEVRCLDHATLMSGPDHSPDPIVGDELICRGMLFLVSGKSGSGKSLMLQSMVLCASVGAPWFGLGTRPTRVGYLALEFDQVRLRQRVRALEADGPAIADRPISWRFRELVPGGLDLLGSKADRAELQGWIEDQELELVIIDTLARVMVGREETNENFALLVSHLDRIVAKTRVTIGLSHHMRKRLAGDRPGQGDPLDEIRGGSTLTAGMGVVGSVQKLRDDAGPRTFEFIKNNYGATPDPIYFRVTKSPLRLSQIEAPQEKAEANQAMVLEKLVELGDWSRIDQLHAITGLSERTLRRHLTDLVDQGLVAVSGSTTKRQFIASEVNSGHSGQLDPGRSLFDGRQEVEPENP